jgi:hypothetical protein
MKIVLTTDRELLKVEGKDFSLTFNGKTNQEYTKIFEYLGITLVWETKPSSIASGKSGD